jgi:hypothetical protein
MLTGTRFIQACSVSASFNKNTFQLRAATPYANLGVLLKVCMKVIQLLINMEGYLRICPQARRLWDTATSKSARAVTAPNSAAGWSQSGRVTLIYQGTPHIINTALSLDNCLGYAC